MHNCSFAHACRHTHTPLVHLGCYLPSSEIARKKQPFCFCLKEDADCLFNKKGKKFEFLLLSILTYARPTFPHEKYKRAIIISVC